MTRFDEPRTQSGNEFVREVTARYIGPRRKGLKISGPGDAACFMRGLLRDEAREHFLALYLNGAHRVVSFSLVSLGTATSAPVSPREVFQGAILVGACALIVGHNHPSGDIEPSPEDVDVTRKLKQAGELLRVPLLDHVLFSETDHLSFHDSRILA
jgi:DNA repair protein RadC